MTNDQSIPVQIEDEQVKLVLELSAIRAQTNALKKRGDEIRDELLEVLESCEASRAITASGEPAIHVTLVPTTRINRKKLEAKYPDVFEDVMEVSTSRKLEIDIPFELVDVRSEA